MDADSASDSPAAGLVSRQNLANKTSASSSIDSFLDKELNSPKQLGLAASIASLGYVFWLVGGMEMVERLAYYGVKSVATIYAKDPISKGGLGISMSDFGNILMTWALIQSIFPVFTGGLSDRYGYKLTIFIATVIKILAYLTMGFWPTYSGFFCGAILLAIGTAVFKPGIQGTLAMTTNETNSSMAWGIFYQTVNIGGFLGPLVAGLMRKMAWQQVFFACAIIISVNFLLLLLYRDPRAKKLPSLDHAPQDGLIQKAGKASLLKLSLHELKKPAVWIYLAVFSGFWFMFNALFDILPAYIQDWVDTAPLVNALFSPQGSINPIAKFFVVMNADGTQILPEGLLNINAGLIMLTCFLFAYLSGKFKATSSMYIGTTFATIAMFLAGFSQNAWFLVLAISIFSVGEMLSSPKFSEFMSNLAPSDKKAMYLGFSQIPLAIGWTLEGKFGPLLYSKYASKEDFSRDLLLERGMDSKLIAAIPQGEAFDHLVSYTGQSAQVLTRFLIETHHVGYVWYIMALIGALSAVAIYYYGNWYSKFKAKTV